MLTREDDAVATFVAQYRNLVRRIVFRLVDDPVDREDVCQETFIKAIRSLGSFRHDSRIGTWIGRIAYRESMQYLRRSHLEANGQRVEIDDEMLYSAEPSPDSKMIRQELEMFVARAVSQLAPAQKTAVTLFYLEEMSVSEIAGVMGMPVNTIKSHLLRARHALRERLSEEARRRGSTT